VMTPTVRPAQPCCSRRRDTRNSPKRLARIAGLLYLIVGIFGGFADAYVPAKVFAPGDAATTAVLGGRTAPRDAVTLGATTPVGERSRSR
jgi:hypothetical protein